MRRFVLAALCVPVLLAAGAKAPLPKLESLKELEAFFFPADEEAVFESMQAVFRLDNPAVLVMAAAAAGPAYAARVAATIDSPVFRSQYARLAKYLDLFGPCQRKQQPDTEGWWSGYTLYPGDSYCSEVTKLVFATTLWSQVHYCHQLATGEVKPKAGLPPGHGPPYRLDEPPVETHWIVPEAVYALADAAAALRFQEVLRRRASEPALEPSEREAMLAAAGELERRPVNREITGLSLLKLMVRSYEGVHLRHLQQLRDQQHPASPQR